MSEVRRRRGRPPVFVGEQKEFIVDCIRLVGLTKTRQLLANNNIAISMVTLGKFAAQEGIQLQRGRPVR